MIVFCIRFFVLSGWRHFTALREQLANQEMSTDVEPSVIYAQAMLATKAAMPRFNILTCNCRALSHRFLRTVKALIELEESECPKLVGGFEAGRNKKLCLWWRAILAFCDFLHNMREFFGELFSTRAGWLKRVDAGYNESEQIYSS